MVDTNAMTSDLIALMEAWLSGHKTRNKHILEKKSGVGYNTISKILQKERNASLETALAILAVVASHEEEKAFLCKHVESFAKHIEACDVVDATNSDVIKEASRDEQKFAIMALAAARGTSFEEVEKIFNSYGLKKLNELLDDGILREVNGRIKSVHNMFMHIDAQTIVTMVKHMANLFDYNGIGKPGRMVKVRTDSINLDDLEKIQKIYNGAFEKASSIASKSNGTMVFTLGQIMSVLGEEG